MVFIFIFPMLLISKSILNANRLMIEYNKDKILGLARLLWNLFHPHALASTMICHKIISVHLQLSRKPQFKSIVFKGALCH